MNLKEIEDKYAPDKPPEDIRRLISRVKELEGYANKYIEQKRTVQGLTEKVEELESWKTHAKANDKTHKRIMSNMFDLSRLLDTERRENTKLKAELQEAQMVAKSTAKVIIKNEKLEAALKLIAENGGQEGFSSKQAATIALGEK